MNTLDKVHSLVYARLEARLRFLAEDQAWDPQLHPRVSAGTSKGGEFTFKNIGGDDGRRQATEPGRGRGGQRSGSGSVAEASTAAEVAAAGHASLIGLPDKPIQFKSDGSWYVPGPIGRIHDAAESYVKAAGIPFDPPRKYTKLDKVRATRVAASFDEMPHDPDNPAVKASYEALAKETLAQWHALKATGLKVEWIKPGQADPYAENPRLGAQDVSINNHWWGFPTDLGFGTDDPTAHHSNPMLALTSEVIDGRPCVVNDIFRIVHDMFGHFKEGVGFRAGGEENAWRSHASMYSDLARGAMTSETRGQNSWVNYGPFGEFNRTANAADTHYAPQKVGLMPEWTWNEGRHDIKDSNKEVITKVHSLVEARLKYIECVSSLYVCRPLLNQDEVRAWMRQVGFPVSIPDMHVTIVYSTTPMDWTTVSPQLDSIRVTGGKRTIEEFGDEATVLTFTSNQLQDRWQQFIDAGASFDWPTYRPHITLTDEDASSLLSVEPFKGDLWFGPEVYREIDPDK